MKLYYSPGACSQAAHIVLHEAEIPHTSEKTDIRAKQTADGSDYFIINPKGAVPALDIGGGEVLTENGAVLQYLGDLAPESGLLPADGVERYRVIEWLSYLGSDVHKSFGPLWNPTSSDDARQAARDLVGKKFDFIERSLMGRDYLMGDRLSVADPYLFAMLGWTGMHGIDLSRWPNLSALRERIAQRESVQTVLRAEGLAG
ncbi:glutathione transferase GstA [Sphingomonas sp. LY29]|uniref:glutathione transferase GstA n=1 Tax=Sphingomonas sp. LY29 TaxID=3095341 RepID=UPI002D79AF6B|nr:glutathione transferase GstA [Sphingomonas sp. LY29]WRP26679.1 glutathione transferase GstA [Sphingomonas sp. LY29]